MKKLEEIRARAEKATEGPWAATPYLYGDDDGRVRVKSPSDSKWYNTAENVLTADAEFIAHSRTDVPKLVAALEAVEALVGAAMSESTYLLPGGYPSKPVEARAIIQAIQEALQ